MPASSLEGIHPTDSDQAMVINRNKGKSGISGLLRLGPGSSTVSTGSQGVRGSNPLIPFQPSGVSGGMFWLAETGCPGHMGLDSPEPVPGFSRVGRPNTVLSLIGEESDIPAEIAVAEGPGEA